MQVNEEQLILIARHFKGETSPDEERKIAEWLEKSDQAKQAYKELTFLWSSGKEIVPVVPNVDQAWSKVSMKAKLGNDPVFVENKTRTLFNSNYMLKIAASLVVVLAAAFLILNQFGKEKLIVITSGDERMEITLPDSSKVWINRNSKLSYASKDFNESNRVVFLEGEAFFEVQKNPSKPFIVQALLSRTEVLGTSFTVRSLSQEKSDEVQVMTGKVSFEYKDDKKEKVILLPGDKASVQLNGKIEKTKIDNVNSMAWKSDRMVFENSTLQEVTEATEEYFNIDIEIANSNLSDCRFTGSFTKPELEEMMKVLSVSMNLSYQKSDSSYVLTGEGCKY